MDLLFPLMSTEMQIRQDQHKEQRPGAECPALPFAALRWLYMPWPQRFGPEAKGASPLPRGGRNRTALQGVLGTPSPSSRSTHTSPPHLPGCHMEQSLGMERGDDLGFTLSPPPCIFKHDSLPQGPDPVHRG